MISTRGVFSLKRCDPEKHEANFCKSETEISEYIADLQVSVWAVFNEMDFTEYKEMPVFRVQDKYNAIRIKKDLV